jgi:hypothetical protein
MNRDIVVKCNLTPEEYVGLDRIADESGLSHSAMIRQLIKRQIRAHAVSVLAAERGDSTETVQE